MGNVINVGPNKAAVISGCAGTRMLIGQSGCQLWCCEQTQYLSLELMTMTITSQAAETIKGVRVDCTSVAQIKVKALRVPTRLTGRADGGQKVEEDDRVGHNGNDKEEMGYDESAIKVAATHFLGDSEENIRMSLLATMEGHQRQILGTLTVEEIYKDRTAFAERVREHVQDDLAAMGFELVSYTVKKIDDVNGYMESLGITQTALVKREAAEGKAKNEAEAAKKVAKFEADARIATAEYNRNAHVSVNAQLQEEAESDRDLFLKRAGFDAEVNREREIAEASGRIEKARQDQTVKREFTQQEVVEAEVRLQVAEQDVLKQQKLQDGESMAELMAEKNKAEAIRVMATAKADEIKMLGEAEARANEAKGAAEAAVLQKKADAWKQYGDAALVQMVVEKLPELAANMAAPLANTKNMVFVSNEGNAGSNLTGDVSRMLSQLPATVEGLTGIDMKRLITRTRDGEGGDV